MNSPTEQQLGAAFRDLVAEQPFTPDVSAIEHRARRARRRDRIVRGGIGAGVVAVAAVAAVGVASAVPSGPTRTAQAGGTHPAVRASGTHPASTGASASSSASASAGASSSHWCSWPPSWPPSRGRRATPRWWNARRTPGGSGDRQGLGPVHRQRPSTSSRGPKSGLPAQVQEDNNQGDGLFAREVAAATYAVTGNLDTAALKMAWAADTTPVPAWLKAQVKNISAGGLQIDNYVWEGSEDALVVGSGNPQVRAGVLRLVSMLPGVSRHPRHR